MSNTPNIVIIGGGASGLAAACAAGHASRESGKHPSIVLIEKNARVGRKILSTGNGRCNLSNRETDARFFHGGSMEAVSRVLDACKPPDVSGFFSRIGLLTAVEDGRIYPYSHSASSVLDVLRMEVERLGITVMTDAEVTKVSRVKKSGEAVRFTVHTVSGEIFSAQSVIVTTGGKAAPDTGSDGAGYRILTNLGHTLTPVFPALSPLTSSHPSLKMLKGLRLKACRLRLVSGGNTVAEESGEVLFTDYGLSGIPALQVSGAANGVDGKQINAVIDLLPQITEGDAAERLQERYKIFKDAEPEYFLTGWFHKRIGQALLREIKLMPSSGGEYCNRLARLMKNWAFPVTGVKGFSHAQVTGGGVPLNEFVPETMSSRLVPGLFAAGEVLDVYGDCGGYNLHWAWATGILAGQGAVNA